MKRPVLAVAFAGAAISVAGDLQGAVSYGTVGAQYTQNFDSLPASPQHGSIDATYPGPDDGNADDGGWRDDTAQGVNAGLVGWYLDHRLDPTGTEDGFNGHQRFRAGPGENTGAFYSFGSSTSDTDRALGDVGSTTTAGNGDSLRIGLRLTNNTGSTLTQFTVTYDGEQWRDGQSTTAEVMNFSYMLAGTDETNWHTAGVSNPATFVPELAFTAPVTAGTSTGGTAVDGHTAGAVNDITFTVTGVEWLPGTDLWLRWSDPQLASNADDGLGIDNVEFTAVPEPTGVAALALGAMALAARRRSR